MRLALAGLLLGLLTMTLAWRQKDAYPPPSSILPALRQDPVQTETDRAPFHVSQGGVRYALTPRAEYELHGLVVSAHDTDSLFDYYHKAWNDQLNVKDLCVVWGENLRPEVLANTRFESGSWTCYATWNRGVPFRMEQLANNHILTDAPALRDALRRVGVGDQIRLAGPLVEYRHDGGFERGTSLRRDDDGCETIYLTDLRILAEASPLWRRLHLAASRLSLGCGLAVLGLLLHGLIRPDPLPAAPANPEALHAQGAALAMRGRHAQALRLLDQALAADPALPGIHADRAICLDALGRLDEADLARDLARNGDREPAPPRDGPDAD